MLTPYNYRLAKEPEYLRDFDALAEETRARDVGLMLIKAGGRNLWREGEDPWYTTWYEPLDEQAHIDAALAFALARPEVTGICTAGDVGLLPLFVEAERRLGRRRRTRSRRSSPTSPSSSRRSCGFQEDSPRLARAAPAEPVRLGGSRPRGDRRRARAAVRGARSLRPLGDPVRQTASRR